MLGQPQITWDESPVVITRRATRTLFLYLAATPKPVGRSLLCELFAAGLPERDARNNLRSLLSKLSVHYQSVNSCKRGMTWCGSTRQGWLLICTSSIMRCKN